ncbi:MAG: hypothetical protein OIF34_04015, partial [Porticoccaceae bacterium]|nr:hypothetical protein [Porticoccaceae bacterium]
MARAQWLVAGSPGSGNVGVLSDLNVEGVTVRFRNGHPHTTRGAHVPAGTPNRNNAATRLFFTFLSQPTDVIGRNNRSDTGWVMDRNASCANVAPRNRRSCWLYRVEGQDYARITYSVLSGQ